MKFNAIDLSAGVNNQLILQDVNFAVSAAKTLVILGPNGSGKSTLLKTLARQLKPLKGRVELNDQDVSTFSPAAFAQRVAYVPQSVEEGSHLTVEELVSLGRSPHQNWWQWQQKENDLAAIDLALHSTGLDDLRHRSVSQLSGGERQRTAIATAVIAQQSSFLLLDEPTAHLDFKYQWELLHLLNELKTKQLGLIVVLHDINAASYLADEVLLLARRKGEPSTVASIGPADSVLESKTLQPVFGVSFSRLTDDTTGQKFFVSHRQKSEAGD